MSLLLQLGLHLLWLQHSLRLWQVDTVSLRRSFRVSRRSDQSRALCKCKCHPRVPFLNRYTLLARFRCM